MKLPPAETRQACRTSSAQRYVTVTSSRSGWNAHSCYPSPPNGKNLGRGRVGEPGRAWSATAGASSMATGLAQLAWLLHEMATRVDVRVTTQPGRWSTEAPSLLWEAFVSGTAKADRGPDGHIADARAAARGFATRIHRLLAADASDVHVGDHRAFNLAAAAALHAELRIEPDEIAATLYYIQRSFGGSGSPRRR
jgi:hypothetical protein